MGVLHGLIYQCAAPGPACQSARTHDRHHWLLANSGLHQQIAVFSLAMVG
jgi:hypothetical protein